MLGLDPELTLGQQTAQLTVQLEQVSPALIPRLPLFGKLLNLALPDNTLTGSLTGPLRKASVESLLVDYLKARATRDPLMLVMEDCHWLDPLSLDLLETVARAIVDLPVVIIVAYRGAEIEASFANRLTSLPHATELRLGSLSEAAMLQLIELRLAQTALLPGLVETLISQAEGNPFYMEELLNFLGDKNVNGPAASSEEVALPVSLYNLVLSRLDQLNETEKGVVKVASVIGRLFKANWLWEIYPAVGEPAEVVDYLEKLDKLDITLLNKPLPELEYLFKHIVTRDVIYQSLSHATRQMLHEHLAAYIERTYPANLDQYLDLLAYHYERSHNQPKQREYLLKAARSAEAAYANQTALSYYRRLLALVTDEEEQIAIKLQMCQILEFISQWSEAITLYEALLEQANRENRPGLIARVQKGLGVAALRRGYFEEATGWLEKSRLLYNQSGDKRELVRVLLELSDAYWRQANFTTAQDYMEQSLIMFEELDDTIGLTDAVNKQAQMYIYQDNYARAGALLRENLERRRALGDKRYLFGGLNNLAVHLYHNDQQYETAKSLLKEALVVVEEVGDRLGKAITFDNLAIIAYHQAEPDEAAESLYQCLYICRELDINNFAYQACGVLVGVLAAQNKPKIAAQLVGGLLAIQQNNGLRLEPPEEQIYQAGLEILKTQLDPSSFEREIELGRGRQLRETFDFALQHSHTRNHAPT